MEPVRTADLVDGVIRVSRALRHAVAHSLAPLGLTPAQERALRVIGHYPDGIRMGELAGRMAVVPRSATSLVEALEEAGLVARTMDPASRRSVLVTLTETGHGVQHGMAQARVAAGERLFGALSPRQQATLAELLDAIVPQDRA